MKDRILFLCALVLIISCAKKDQPDEAKALYDESMRSHDEIMPRMDKLFGLKQKLIHRIDSLKADSTARATTIQECLTALDKLARADKGMMDWMHTVKDVASADSSFSAHTHGSNHTMDRTFTEEEMLTLLRQQREKIKEVKTDMEESIAEAETLLNRK